MKYLFVLLLLSSINFSAISQENNKPTDARLEGIDSLLNRVLKDQHIAGFSVAVVEGDKVIYSKGFGYRDVENKKPVTPNTLFAIGSSTKAFTSALLGILQKEGKLSLDGNAVSYLPQLRFFNDNMNNQIIVRDMMTHRTGLSRYDLSWYVFNTSNRDSIISRVRYMEPNAGLREKWQYNNYMFLAQGMIAEKLTGKTWEQNIKERFFLPLEMKRSNTSMAEFKKDADASLPYELDGDVIKKTDYYDIDGMGPAGSINSSVNDMANWIKTWISGGYYNGKEILSSDYIAEAASPQMVMGGGLPGAEPDVYMSSYGLGWMINSYRGHYKVEHGGNIDGFSASVSFFPTDKLGVVVLTNQNVSSVPSIVLNSITDRLFKLKPIDWNSKSVEANRIAKEKKANLKKEADLKHILNTKPSHPLKEYTGVFENPAYGLMDISVKNDSLFVKVGKYRVWLKHYHYDVFEWREINKDGKPDTSESNLKFNFLTNNDGKIESLSASFELKSPIFTLKPKIVNLDLKTLEQYEGVYMLGTMEVKVSVRNKVLYVFVPGQQDYETIALGDHNFKLKALEGYNLRFEVKGNGKAESVLFIQPNGTFKAVRKS
ncbi:serine hydrolase [Pedobacter foliorum]|uniref:serine hydrolase n=1 Tax=Pedobacter foliorum TaxID=2739058 RepID=UPI00156594B6|nr:serine hydrolase [Pedobacter foliorum]NRF40669.1 serine hydrolase [Pedobacter foliorum]